MVFQAAETDPARKAVALDTLFRSYWKPLYLFARGRVGGHEEAEDLTQGFFAHLLSQEIPAGLKPENGRFRSWLLAALKNFIVSQYRHSTRQKRGGSDLQTVALECVESDIADPSGLDSGYEMEWARSVLANSWECLRAECEALGQVRRFQVLSGAIFDPENGAGASSAHASELGITHNAAKVALSRLRMRYRELLRKEVARLVDDPADVDAEIAYLANVLRRG